VSHVWIPLLCLALLGVASLVIGALGWIRRNPAPKCAPGQPEGGWPPPTVAAMAQAGWIPRPPADGAVAESLPSRTDQKTQDAGAPDKSESIEHNFPADECLVMICEAQPHAEEFLEHLREHIRSVLAVTPPLRQKPLESGLWESTTPYLISVDDPNFDLDHHIRRIELRAPGGEHELNDFIARIAESPLDRNRPLWALWFIEGLVGGRIAIVLHVNQMALDKERVLHDILPVKTNPDSGARYLFDVKLEKMYLREATHYSRHSRAANVNSRPPPPSPGPQLFLPLDDPYQVPDGYPIKASARFGLYYTPGSELYHDALAEIWLASEEAALANGFIKAD
jgi:Wax ester synthase-like Acyl-CoA acyltransferase domain